MFVQSGYVPIDHGRLFFQIFGSGSPLIVLHGGPGLDQNYLLPSATRLAEGYKVIFYDQRGSGKSLDTPLDDHFISLIQFTDDLEQLRLALGLDTFALMGHSWGGFLAMNYALKYPGRASSLILVSSAPADYKGHQAYIDEMTKRTAFIKEDLVLDYERFKKLSACQISTLYRKIFSVYVNNPQDAERLNLEVSEISAQSGFKVKQIIRRNSWLQPYINLSPALEDLALPTLILHGNQDVVPIHTAYDLKKAIPHSQLVCLDQCGHFPYIEKPESFFSAVRHFLDPLS